MDETLWEIVGCDLIAPKLILANVDGSVVALVNVWRIYLSSGIGAAKFARDSEKKKPSF